MHMRRSQPPTVTAPNNGLGAALRQHRTIRQLPINAVADQAKLDRAYLRRLEGQESDWLNMPLHGGPIRQPSRDTVIRIGVALGLGIGELDDLLLVAGYAPLVPRKR